MNECTFFCECLNTYCGSFLNFELLDECNITDHSLLKITCVFEGQVDPTSVLWIVSAEVTNRTTKNLDINVLSVKRETCNTMVVLV